MFVFLAQAVLHYTHRESPSNRVITSHCTCWEELRSLLRMTVNSDTQSERPVRKLSFNSRVTVVLIPQRKEIKEAGCDLWWNRNDYTSFQQSAQSEIRLYAMYENTSCKEAKSMLYQPTENDLKMNSEEDDLDEGWDLAMDGCFRNSEETNDESEESFSPIMLRHVDSVTLLSDHVRAETASPPTPAKSVSSARLSPTKPKQSPEEDLHPYVSFCVASQAYEPLVERENVRAASRGRPAQRIDHSSGFAVACGIFSFTLPIIGYYLMHYSS